MSNAGELAVRSRARENVVEALSGLREDAVELVEAAGQDAEANGFLGYLDAIIEMARAAPALAFVAAVNVPVSALAVAQFAEIALAP